MGHAPRKKLRLSWPGVQFDKSSDEDDENCNSSDQDVDESNLWGNSYEIEDEEISFLINKVKNEELCTYLLINSFPIELSNSANLYREDLNNQQAIDTKIEAWKYVSNYANYNEGSLAFHTVNDYVIEIYSVEETATYYDCDQSDYVTTKKLLLKFHVQAKYEGLRFPCDHRGYKATQKHTGIVFNFDKYKAWVKIELLDQTRSIHDKNPYLCDICDIVGMSKENEKVDQNYKEISDKNPNGDEANNIEGNRMFDAIFKESRSKMILCVKRKGKRKKYN